MSKMLRQAALDDAYKSGIVDADNAAMHAIYDRFRTRPSDKALCQSLMHVVGMAIYEAMVDRYGVERMAAVSDRAILSPRDERGQPIQQ